LVTNDGDFDDRFARNLLPIALIKSEEQIEAFSNAHLRQLLISHPRNAAIQLKRQALLEQVLTCWRELQEGYKKIDEDIPSTDYDFNCVVCQAVEATHLCVPCGHQVLCGQCQKQCQRFGYRTCPLCRKRIEQFVEVKYAN
ncbi:hypothetical protein FGIG_03455, partial [Fasciola gigantica]